MPHSTLGDGLLFMGALGGKFEIEKFLPRAEFLKQECNIGKVVSNIHRLGPKNAQQNQNELKHNLAPPSAAPYRGRRFVPPPWDLFFNSFAIFVYFLGPACVCC